VLLYQLQ